jgi:simple sugar transport system ATP-binding protein
VPRVNAASLQVHAGETIGVAAVDGSGYRELLLALAGRLAAQSGALHLPDEIGFVPDDRLNDGLLPDQSIVDNVALRSAGERRGWYRHAHARSAAARLVEAFGIQAADMNARVSTLSGGNQQRLVVARELDGAPRLIVAVNPTRGLDVAAAADVRRRLLAAADAGSAVVYYSPDLDEVLAIADRVVVVFDGRVREVPRDRALVGRAMLGAA